jgi:hypothetical protein
MVFVYIAWVYFIVELLENTGIVPGLNQLHCFFNLDFRADMRIWEK